MPRRGACPWGKRRVKIPGKGTSIGGETYQSLRGGILGGEIPPGDKVRTQELCKRLGVSLGAVREALSQLMAEGLILAEAHKGYTVAPISVDDLKDLTRIRTEIETLCLTWSMEAGKIEWESEVIAATHRLTKTYRIDRSSRRLSSRARWRLREPPPVADPAATV